MPSVGFSVLLRRQRATSFRSGRLQEVQRITRDKSGEKWIVASMAESTNRNKQLTMIKNPPCDPEYEFVLVLGDVPDLTTEVEDALYEAGCSDGTIGMQAGRLSIDFTRRAASKKDAILSAIKDVRNAKIGARVLRVDDCDLVTQAEIGRRIERSRQQVHQYVSGERGPGGFPPPVCQIIDGTPLWHWCEVAYWLASHDMITEEAMIAARDTETINAILSFVNQQATHPDLVADIMGQLPDLLACSAK
jgi:hypothetical protein